MKYIIEIEPIYGTDLYRAKGARTLVFDQNGVNQILTPYEEKKLKRWVTIKSDNDVNRLWALWQEAEEKKLINGNDEPSISFRTFLLEEIDAD